MQGPAAGCVFEHFSGTLVGQSGPTSVGVGRCGRDGGQEHWPVASPRQQAGQETGGFGFPADEFGAGVFADHDGTAAG